MIELPSVFIHEEGLLGASALNAAEAGIEEPLCAGILEPVNKFDTPFLKLEIPSMIEVPSDLNNEEELPDAGGL